MRYVLIHRAFPIPPILDQAERDIIVEAQRKGIDGVTIGQLTFSMQGISIMPQDVFLANDKERLSWKKQARCKWGRVHDLDDHGSHEECRSAARRGSPFLTDDALEALIHPKLALGDGGVEQDVGTVSQEKVVAGVERMLETGHAVFRTLVRKFRDTPHLVSSKYTAICEAFGGVPIDQVPMKMPMEIPGVATSEVASDA